MLTEKFIKLCKETPCKSPSDDQIIMEYFRLSSAYSFNRFYHTMKHVEDCMIELEAFPHYDSLLFVNEMELAFFFHDFVVGCNNAELSSAIFAINLINKYALKLDAGIVQDLILQTSIKNIFKREYILFDYDVFSDIDLSILGRSRNVFLEYDKNIGLELGTRFSSILRKRFLESLIQLPNIYRTSYYQNLCEEQARENISFILGSRYKL